MTYNEYPFTFSAIDFAKSFDDDANNFSDKLNKKIIELDFRYRFPTNEENEKLIHNALLKIDADKK